MPSEGSSSRIIFGLAIIGLVIYALYGYRHSDLGKEHRGGGPRGGTSIPPEPPFHEGPQA